MCLFDKKFKKNSTNDNVKSLIDNCNHMISLAKTLPQSESKNKLLEQLNLQSEVINKITKNN